MKVTYGIAYSDHTARFKGTVIVPDGTGIPHIADVIFGMYSDGSEYEPFVKSHARDMGEGDLLFIYAEDKMVFLVCEEFNWGMTTKNDFNTTWRASKDPIQTPQGQTR